MSELSKFINLLIEFQQKIEGAVNKKYRHFIRSVLNLQALTKHIKPDKIFLTKQLIIFKLGLQSKSLKSIEISLNYLIKLFQMKFVDVNQPNYCENYVIEVDNVKEIPVPQIQKEIRHQLVRLIEPLIHFKSNEINRLMLKTLEYLISEPILPLILEICTVYPLEPASTVLFNFFSFRFYVFEEIYTYTEAQMLSFNTLVLKNQRMQKQIKNAFDEHKRLYDLISRYMRQYLSIIEGGGGRYGYCVMCNLPADHYCKITRASLCGLQCKKKHIQIAERQYKHYFQSISLWDTIYSTFKELLMFLEKRECPIVFTVLVNLLQRPHLFMITKVKFRALIGKHAPNILSKILSYKNQLVFEHIYYFASSLTKFWLYECISSVQYFFKQYIIKILEDKKPNFKFLILIFKSLARMFQYGKVTIQLYINFDCEVNKQNIIEKIMFELAKMSQDKFHNANHFTREQKITIKKHCISIYIIMIQGLNQYRKQESKIIEIEQIVTFKHKKSNLEQFLVKFNQHWTNGLKSLFNLNLVGLDSTEEIVDIITNLKGLRKENIDMFLFSQGGAQYLQVLLNKIKNKNGKKKLIGLLQLHHYIPINRSSVGVKKYIESISTEQINEGLYIQKWMNILSRNFTFDQIKKQLLLQNSYNDQVLEQIFIYAFEAKQALTTGSQKLYFTYCGSKSYLDVISSQISLLQIPISYLLETDYDIERILELISELVQICPHSNWLALLIKNSNISKFPHPEQFNENKLRIVQGVLQIIQKQAGFIQDWSTVIYFINTLYHIILQIQNKKLIQHKIFLSDTITIPLLQHCLIESSSKSEKYYNRFMLSILAVAKDQLQKENIFMLQKFFQLFETNARKSLHNITQLLPHLDKFTRDLQKVNPEHCIYISDMLKQSCAKILKISKNDKIWISKAQADYFRLFQNILSHRNKQVTDFVINCITMTILHHYQLGYPTFILIFKIMKKQVKKYRNQVFTIIEKILKQKLKYCQNFYTDVIQICLELIDQNQTKLSAQSLHSIKACIDTAIECRSINKQIQEQDQKLTKEIKETQSIIIKKLLSCLYYNCHESILQTFFIILKIKIKEETILNEEQTDTTISDLFSILVGNNDKLLVISEKTLTYCLNWSTNNKYSQIIRHLQRIIIKQFNQLSLSALKCIKTYIQIVKPQSKDDWSLIQKSLVNIIKKTRLSNIIDLQNEEPDDNSFEDQKINFDVGLFLNKIVIQRLAIELIPNITSQITQLLKVYEQTIKYNDNLYLRILCWRRRMFSENTQHPPQLLKLQELLSFKILSIYNQLNQDELFRYSTTFFERFYEASQIQIQLEHKLREDSTNQFLEIERRYLHDRKIPLVKMMNYFLSKLAYICTSQEQKKSIILKIVKVINFVQKRQDYLKAIKQFQNQ